MNHKKFMDIERIKKGNVENFRPGDYIYIEEKIDGCFHSNTRITLADESYMSIGEIVKKRLPVEVMCYNEENDSVEPRKVVGWFDNGEKKFVRLQYQCPHRQGGQPSSVICTPNHKYFTQRGYVAVQDLKKGDYLYTFCNKIDYIQQQMILGTLIGDSSIFPSTIVTTNCNLGISFVHGEKQKEYAEFKNKVLGVFYKNSKEFITGYGSNAIISHSVICKETMSVVKDCVDENYKKKINEVWLNKLSPIGLAFWYMDDGSLRKEKNQTSRATLHTEGYTKEENELMLRILENKYGITGSVISYKKYYKIDLNKKGSEIFFSLIAPYIIKCMQYKLPEMYQNNISFWDECYFKNREHECNLYSVRVINIEPAPDYFYKMNRHGYDLEVEGNHNYFANDCLVHNCNAAIRYDETTKSIVAQSRKQILTPTNNLRGFYEFTQRLDIDKIHEVLSENLVAFGEWLCPHTVKYPDDKYNNFYMYDVYDLETQSYLPQEKAIEIATKLDLTYVPIFYTGEFQSWEHCMSFVGKTELGGEYGEGIVVKNQTRLNDPNGRQPFYLKIVGEQFAETKAHKYNKIKQTNADVLAKLEADKALAETIVTEARVNKILLKLVDEGILPENWGAKEMGIVAKNLPREVYTDCIKEEPEIVKQIDNFGKIANSIAMGIARTKI